MQSFKHQQKIIDDDPRWCGLFLGVGSGKTKIALELAKGTTLIIMPRQQVLDRTWELNMNKFGIILPFVMVLSKETFRRDWQSLETFDTVIIDEGHTLIGITPDTKYVNRIPVPKTSQLFNAIHLYIKKHPPKRFYIATGTPVSKPMHVFALGVLLNRWSLDAFFKFREKYYFNRKIGNRNIWLPKKTKELEGKLAELTKSMGYTGKLDQWFDVPEQKHETIYIELTQEQKDAIKEIDLTEADPMVKRAKKRTIENGCLYDYEIKQITDRTERLVKHTVKFNNLKLNAVLQYAINYPKLLIFANYTAQIEQMRDFLIGHGYAVKTLTGQTKHREDVIRDANALDACIVIAQCSVSAGYELPDYPCVIFASKSYRYVDFVQAQGRILRVSNLKENLYAHLVVKDGIDELCHKTILSGRDFEEKIYETS